MAKLRRRRRGRLGGTLVLDAEGLREAVIDGERSLPWPCRLARDDPIWIDVASVHVRHDHQTQAGRPFSQPEDAAHRERAAGVVRRLARVPGLETGVPSASAEEGLEGGELVAQRLLRRDAADLSGKARPASASSRSSPGRSAHTTSLCSAAYRACRVAKVRFHTTRTRRTCGRAPAADFIRVEPAAVCPPHPYRSTVVCEARPRAAPDPHGLKARASSGGHCEHPGQRARHPGSGVRGAARGHAGPAGRAGRRARQGPGRRRAEVHAAAPGPGKAAGARADRAAHRSRLPVPRALAAGGLRNRLPGGRQRGHRHRHGLRHRVRADRQRPDGPRRVDQPVDVAQGAPGLGHRAAQPAAADQPGRVGRRRPAHAEGDLHPRGPDLPRPDPDVGGRDPDDRPGVRQLHGRRRLPARDERLRGDGGRPGQGIPRRAAAGQDGHRGGVRRRVPGRGRHARAPVRAGRLPGRRRARCAADRPVDRGQAQLARPRPRAARPGRPGAAAQRG